MTAQSKKNKAVFSEVILLSSITLPEIKQENFATQHVPYGANDDYLDKVNEYASYSPTHKSILLLKQNMITGKGFTCNKKKSPVLDKVIKKLNPKERSQKTLAKIARDYAKYNGFSFQVIWNKLGTHIAEIYWIDFSRLRAEAALDGVPKAYYFSRNWKKYRSATFKPIRIPVFNPENVLSTDKEGKQIIAEPRQIYYYYEEENDLDFYPVPTYNAAYKDFEYDFAYGMYKGNMMENNMWIPGIVHYNFIPSPDEQKDVKEKLLKKYSGVKNAGKIMITFSDKGSGQKSVEFQQMSFSPDASLLGQWYNEAIQGIMTAHQLSSPTLAGIAGNGGLGGNASEIYQAFVTYLATYVDDKQADIVDVFQEVLKYKEGVTDTESLDIKTSLPPTEIPDWVIDYANAKTVQKWATERYGVEFEPDDMEEDGQLPVPFENNNRNGNQQPAKPGIPKPLPAN